VDWVVEKSRLASRAMELARQIAQFPQMSVQMSKPLMNHIHDMTLDAVLEREQANQSFAFFTKDHEEGIKAFMEKREPRFNRE
jgi:2-(1,2-epoxy-1,2-dihydrophenyl)acetyl-CoA isomerase